MAQTRVNRQDISQEQADYLLAAGWRDWRHIKCDRYTYEPPNGIGATGGMSAVWGYLKNECQFFVACARVL